MGKELLVQSSRPELRSQHLWKTTIAHFCGSSGTGTGTRILEAFRPASLTIYLSSRAGLNNMERD